MFRSLRLFVALLLTVMRHIPRLLLAGIQQQSTFLPLHRIAFLLLPLLLTVPGANAQGIMLTAPTTDSDGSYVLSWTGMMRFVELYEQTPSGWVLLMKNTNTSYPVSGKPAGSYTYKLKNCTVNPWGAGIESCPEEVIHTVIVTVSGPPNTAPVIAGLPTVLALDQFSTLNLPFTVSDTQTPGSALIVEVFPPASTITATVTGNDTYRTLTLTAPPTAIGTVSLTIRVSDGALFAYHYLTVNMADIRPQLTISPTHSTTGSYTLNWNYGTHAVAILENGVDITYALMGTYESGKSNSKTITKPANGTFTYSLRDCIFNGNMGVPTCTGNYSPVTVTVAIPAPIVNATFSPANVNEGGSSTLGWSSSGAHTCSSAQWAAVSGTGNSLAYPVPTVMGNTFQDIPVTVTCHGEGGSTSKTATLRVTGVNDAPVSSLGNLAGEMKEDRVFSFDFTATDEENALNELTVTVTSSDTGKVALGGIVIDKPARKVYVTPVANAHGNVTLTLNVSDPQGASASPKTLSVTLAPEDDAPVIGAISPVTMTESSVVDSTVFTVTDVDSPVATLQVDSDQPRVSATVVAQGGSSYRLHITAGALNVAGHVTANLTVRAGAASVVVPVTVMNQSPLLTVSTTHSTDGSYTLNWNYGTHAVAILENGVDITQALLGTYESGQSNSKTITKPANGTFTYSLRDCVFNGNMGIPTCTGNYSPVTVTVAIPVPVIGAINPVTMTESSSVNSGTFSITGLDSPVGTLQVNSDQPRVSAIIVAQGGNSYRLHITAGALNVAGHVTANLTVRAGATSVVVPVTVMNQSPLLTVSTTHSTDGSYTLNWNYGTHAVAILENGVDITREWER